MSENIDEKILEARKENLDYNEKVDYDNYVVSQELTVTITLNEYRNLISNKAKHKTKIQEIKDEKHKEWQGRYEAERERDKYKDKLTEANEMLNAYMKAYGIMEIDADDEDEEGDF